jgi:Zn-dependent alcohol dehydrogenase
MRIRAAIFAEHGQPLIIDDVDLPDPGPTHVAVKIAASRPERDFPMYVRWFRQGRLPLDELVTRRYSLEQINDALDDLQNGRIAGRSIIVM